MIGDKQVWIMERTAQGMFSSFKAHTNKRIKSLVQCSVKNSRTRTMLLGIVGRTG